MAEAIPSAYEVMGYPNYEKMERKALLVREIEGAMAARGIARERAAIIAGIEEDALARMLRGKFRNTPEATIEGVLEKLNMPSIVADLS